MARPRVFVSSTYYDLLHVRNDVESFLRSVGFEAVMFEHGVIPFRDGVPREDQCYAEVERCDIVVSIIGSAFGTASAHSPGSISHNEMRRAGAEGKQSYAFVQSNVMAAHRLYQLNRENHNVKYGIEIEILKFIDELQLIPSLGIHQFTNASDITSILREQWASLFQELLTTRAQVRQQQSLNKISELASKMEESLKNYGQMYRGVWGFAHPAIAQLRELLDVKHHVFFTNLRECDDFLSTFGYERREPDPDDEHLKWTRHDGAEVWIMNDRLFLKNGSMPIPPPRWDPEWIKHTPAPPFSGFDYIGGPAGPDDEIPF